MEAKGVSVLREKEKIPVMLRVSARNVFRGSLTGSSEPLLFPRVTAYSSASVNSGFQLVLCRGPSFSPLYWVYCVPMMHMHHEHHTEDDTTQVR